MRASNDFALRGGSWVKPEHPILYFMGPSFILKKATVDKIVLGTQYFRLRINYFNKEFL